MRFLTTTPDFTAGNKLPPAELAVLVWFLSLFRQLCCPAGSGTHRAPHGSLSPKNCRKLQSYRSLKGVRYVTTAIGGGFLLGEKKKFKKRGKECRLAFLLKFLKKE